MRREHLSLAEAAGRAGTTTRAVVRHAGEALEFLDGRYAVLPVDHIARPMNLLTKDGPIEVVVRDSRVASFMSELARAQKHYRDTGDASRLHPFKGRKLVEGGREIAIVTDPATLDRLAEGGELHYDLYRR